MLGAVSSDLPYVFSLDPGVLVYAVPADIKVFSAADISLTIEDAAGVTVFTPEQGAHYTVALSQTFAATITFLANDELDAGRNGVLSRMTAASQPTQFSELTAFPGLAVEMQADRQAAMAQDIWALLKRSLLAARGEALPRLPSRADIAGGVFYLKADESGWEILSATDIALVAEDLALGSSSAIRVNAENIAGILALAARDAELLELAPYADALGNISDNLAALLALVDAVTLPELTWT